MTDQQDSGNFIKFPSQLEIAGIVLAALPFVCSFSSSSTRTVNGRVVEESNFDVVAAVAGAVAIGIGVFIVTYLARTHADDRLKRMGVIAGVILVGAFQLLVRGLGVV